MLLLNLRSLYFQTDFTGIMQVQNIRKKRFRFFQIPKLRGVANGLVKFLNEDGEFPIICSFFHMEGMITDRIIEKNEATCDRMEKAYRDMGMVEGGMSAVSELLSAFTYAYVGIRTVTDFLGKQLSLGSLTMYVSSTISFSTTVSSFGEQVVNLLQIASFLAPYEEFMALEEETITDGGVKFTGEVETVEFRDVTFTYPKAENYKLA